MLFFNHRRVAEAFAAFVVQRIHYSLAIKRSEIANPPPSHAALQMRVPCFPVSSDCGFGKATFRSREVHLLDKRAHG